MAAAASEAVETTAAPVPLPIEPPIRSVLFGRGHFEQHAARLALSHECRAVRAPAAVPFFPRLDENIAVIRGSVAALERLSRDGLNLGPAAQWLLDNASLIDEQVNEVRRQLPARYFARLPVLCGEPLDGLPRIYGIAWAWVAHSDSGLDAELLCACLQAYDRERELSLAELWALPTTLRLVLIENLRRLAERTAAMLDARERAHSWLEQAHAPAALAELEHLGQALSRRGVLQAFALQLSLREADVPHALHAGLRVWLDTHLPDPAAAQAQLHDEMTRDHQSVRNAITSLRGIDRLEWRELIAGVSVTVRTLARSPVFSAERQDTQDETLRAVEQLALDGGLPESRVAAELMRRVDAAPAPDAPEAAPGHWCLGAGREALRQALGLPPAGFTERLAASRRWRAGLHLAALGLPTLLMVAWLMPHGAAAASWSAGLLALTALLLAFPVSELVVSLVNRLISESVPPARLPRLALDEGLGPQRRTLVVIPCMLSSDAQTDELVAQLEQHHLSTRDPQVQYALLSDWADASTPHAADDEALLQHAEQALRTLNRMHGPAGGAADHDAPAAPRFLLLHRMRRYSSTEARWIGHERKRGKLEQLVGWLDEAGRSAAPPASPFLALDALTQVRHPVRHVMTLDSDTDMPPGRLLELVGIAAHPLNRPRLDAQHRRVVAGHAILQPRVALPLAARAARTRFHRLFAGQGGIDPYSAASSEIYQDLHGEGTFTGKGLLDVQALHAVLGARLPEGHVLSHDLLEGAIARCAGVSDVTLVEDAPGHPDVAASRIHRWTRGDWQLLPFLLAPRRWPMALISRWKMVDNLRRSLVAPATLALIVLALATGVLPPGRVLLLALLAHAIGPLLGTVAGLAPSRDDISLGLFWRRGLADMSRALGAGAWHLALLLDQALLSLDAIARALWRQCVSRRRLLEWTTAASAAAAASTALPALARRHAPTTLAAAALAGALALAGPAATLPWALGLALLWALAPVWVAWGARVPGPPPAPLAEPVRQSLRHLARDTWRFYLRTVTAEENHLPPDNLQLSPQPMIASRTSPTNIGMYLLGVATARAFGFIGVGDMVRRLDATLSTLERLPRHRGHFLNWYDTRTLAVLPPAYVSTVDSGNLGGHLLAVAGACEELATQPQLWHGQPMLRLALGESAQRLAPLRPALLAGRVTHRLAQLAPMRELPPVDEADFALLPQWLAEARAELDALWQRVPEVDAPGGDERSLWLLRDHLDTLEALLEDLRAPASLEGRLRELAVRCRTLALAPDYAMLFDPVRRLLHIGLRADSGQLDGSHYDLLASECRLTSLLAIAKGDVPVRHWSALGRPFAAIGDQVGLRSWSGSMFEYLMPSLVLDEPQGSVLDQAARAAVWEQRAQGAHDGLPWGVSESAHAARDHTLAYQYGPQGAARLALRRTPPDERVIAPYATVMALMVDLPEAMANLQRLGDLQARGPLGFIEALDFTVARQERPGEPVRVDTVMAHHQGMSLVALAGPRRADARGAAAAARGAPARGAAAGRAAAAAAAAPGARRAHLADGGGAAGRPGGDAAAGQRPLQRGPARAWRRLEPLAGRRHQPLARRRAARLARHGAVADARGRPALGADHADRDARARSVGALPHHARRRPGGVRGAAPGPAQPRRGARQPGGRSRAAPGRAGEPGRSTAAAAPGLEPGGDAVGAARRRGASGLRQSLRRGGGRPRRRGDPPAPQAAAAGRGGGARGSLPRRCAGRARRAAAVHHRPRALARALARAAPAARRRGRRAGRAGRCARHRAGPGGGDRRAADAGAGRAGAADLRHRGGGLARAARCAGRQVPPAHDRRPGRGDVAHDGGDPAARDAARRRELGRAAAPDHRADRAAVARGAARRTGRAGAALRPAPAVAPRDLGRPPDPAGDGVGPGRAGAGADAQARAAAVDAGRPGGRPGGGQHRAGVLPQPGPA